MIFKCICKHEYQDRRYGVGMRVHTPKLKVQGKEQEYTCTVCGVKRKQGEK